jgi:RNA polymerase sigma-70 factor (ECF subfamily)
VDDAEAVALVRQSDGRGAEALLAKYQMSMYNLTLRLLGNPADAEDATQEAFLRAFTRLDQYRTGEAFGAWLHGIARNCAIDVLRRRRPEADLLALGSPTDVEGLALASLEQARVRAALDRMSGRDRALLVLRYWEDQPLDAIARTLGMREGAVKVALLRARRSMAAMLSGMEEETHAV